MINNISITRPNNNVRFNGRKEDRALNCLYEELCNIKKSNHPQAIKDHLIMSKLIEYERFIKEAATKKETSFIDSVKNFFNNFATNITKRFTK